MLAGVTYAIYRHVIKTEVINGVGGNLIDVLQFQGVFDISLKN
jgi:hypothetical protein